MAAMADWQELVRKTMKKEKCTYREAQQTAKPIWQKLKKKKAKDATKVIKKDTDKEPLNPVISF